MMGVLFIDLEASSLSQSSFPIEVGWVDEGGRGESHLIRPTEAWLDAARDGHAWDAASERLHGLSLDMLVDRGEPHREVAERTMEVMSRPGTIACSDAPGHDAAWLRDLFEASGMRLGIKIHELHEQLGLACRPLLAMLAPEGSPRRADEERRIREMATRIVATASRRERLRPGVSHRALEDAMGHWRTWREVSAEAQRSAEAARTG